MVSLKLVLMNIILWIRGDLCDFLHKNLEKGFIKANLSGHETVKHVIETIGIPHTEIGEICINQESVGFDQRLTAGDMIEVFPWYGKWGGTFHSQIRPDPPQLLKFVLDSHLGKLASYLRLLGLDTIYRNDFEDFELATISCEENRFLLTRDRCLLKRRIVTYGYWVRETQPRRQLLEIINRFDIKKKTGLFTRCAICNGLLNNVPKTDIIHLLEHKTRLYYDNFRKCSDCGQIYWKGSHFKRMEELFSDILNWKITGNNDQTRGLTS